MQTTTISDAEVQMRLGITPGALQVYRQDLVEGQDYVNNGRRLAFTQAGFERLADMVAGKGSVAALPPAPEVVELVVWRTVQHGLKNHHILEAFPPGKTTPLDSEIVRVRVRESEKYVRNMRISARKIAEGLFEHWNPELGCAARPPRFRGKI